MMKITRGVFFITLLCSALHAQSSDSFVPIFEDRLNLSTEFVDGESTVADIEIIGLDPEADEFIEHPVYASNFLKQLRYERIGFVDDKTFTGYKVHSIAKKVREWLSDVGYEYAKVTALGMRLPDNQLRIRFSVKRGPLISTAAFRFVSNERISGAEFVENLKGCLGEEWERYDRRKYEYFTQKCSRSLMHSKGFFQAKIVDTKSEVRDGVRTVAVIVFEGPRYRLGNITVEGNQVFSDQEILKFLGQKRGDVADGRGLKDFVYEKLKQKYDELGYVQYNAEFDPDFRTPDDWKLDGIVNVSLSIDEGRRFKVRRIVFDGVTKDQQAALRGEFLMKSGDVFSYKGLQDAIDKVNELDRFERLDKDQDVEIRTDEESGEIDLFIALKIYKQ